MIPDVPRGRARATLLALVLAVALVTAVVPVGAAPPPATPAAAPGTADVYLVHGVNVLNGAETPYPVSICAGATKVTSLSFGQSFRWTDRPIGSALTFTVRDGAAASCTSGKVIRTVTVTVAGPSAVVLQFFDFEPLVFPLDTSCIGPTTGRLTVGHAAMWSDPTNYELEGTGDRINLGELNRGQSATITPPAATYEVWPAVRQGSLPPESVDVAPQSLTAVFYVGNQTIDFYDDRFTPGVAVVINLPLCGGLVYLVNGIAPDQPITFCRGSLPFGPPGIAPGASAEVPVLEKGALDLSVRSGAIDCAQATGPPLATTSVPVDAFVPTLVVARGPATGPSIATVPMTGCLGPDVEDGRSVAPGGVMQLYGPFALVNLLAESVTYLYTESDAWVFMGAESFDQFTVPVPPASPGRQTTIVVVPGRPQIVVDVATPQECGGPGPDDVDLDTTDTAATPTEVTPAFTG
jgi:hypothetical protein